jgi:hypothetical protein
MWQCGSGILQGRSLSKEAVRVFHDDLNNGRYEQIWENGDVGFRGKGTQQELTAFFQAVHRKLGDAGASDLRNISVNATPTGTFITTVYQTTFAKGSATETFTWLKSSGHLKLYGYNIQSMALVMN